MSVIKLNADRPFLEVVRDGEVVKWEYDLITIKLECERLERAHGLFTEGSAKAPGKAMLAEFAAYLEAEGLTGCTPDIAFRVHRLVRAQFHAMMEDLQAQIDALDEKKPKAAE